MSNWLARLSRGSRVPDANSPFYNRRVYMLSRHLASAIPGRGTVLDIGAGDGQIAMALMRLRPDLRIEGVDTIVRPRTLIPVTHYDGPRLPFADKSVDYAVIVDRLFRATDPAAMLIDAARVARRGVVIKDFMREGALAEPTLALMTRFGNRGGDVHGPARFLSRREWQGEFFKSRLEVESMIERLDLYLPPASLLFDRKLHFVAYLTPKHA